MKIKSIVKDNLNLSSILKDDLKISSRLFTKIKKKYVFVNGEIPLYYKSLSAR